MIFARSLPAALVAASAFAALCAPALAQDGIGAWYQMPGRTACGEQMNPSALTAAHRTLPCGTRISVTNKRTGKRVIVRVNDRGPFTRGRVVDLSRAAADEIGLRRTGVAPVSVRVVGW
jgi:rare lipoprotein A